jgi:hypothetical protein
MKLALLAIFLALPLPAQTAKVIALSQEDAKLAKSLYEERDLVNKKIAELDSKVKKDYLLGEKGSSCGQNGKYYMPGWGCGEFEFSEDFKFIVPKPSCCSGITLWNCCFGGGVATPCSGCGCGLSSCPYTYTPCCGTTYSTSPAVGTFTTTPFTTSDSWISAGGTITNESTTLNSSH